MTILFIAPFPPPISGNSLAVQLFKDHLDKSHNIELVNFNKKRLKTYFNSFARIFEVLNILKQVFVKKKTADVIYFSISESVAGNLKDIFIYLICFRKLPKTIIHLHGGEGMKQILSNSKSLMFKVNSFFIRRLGGVIILGQSHFPMFNKIIPQNKIHIVPNFAEDYLFRNCNEINKKFKEDTTLNILFLSNLINGKGHDELLDAYLSLENGFKNLINIDFAGEFASINHRVEFLKKIDGCPGITYHGFVSGNEKKELLAKAHVFCLPTYYPYEGQPISILEAYASGCVVITTDHSGIKDIFSDGINGFWVEKGSVVSIRQVLEQILNNKDILPVIGNHNRNVADKKYRTTIFNSSLEKLIAGIG